MKTKKPEPICERAPAPVLAYGAITPTGRLLAVATAKRSYAMTLYSSFANVVRVEIRSVPQQRKKPRKRARRKP